MTEDSHLCTRNSICMPTTRTRLSSWNYSLCSSWQLCPISQQTAGYQTLWTSLCETLILGVSLSWRIFHTGTRRHFLEYTDAVISTWIRQTSPKDRKNIYTPEANLVQTESIWTWGSLSTLYYKVWNLQHNKLAPRINISQSVLHHIMV